MSIDPPVWLLFTSWIIIGLLVGTGIGKVYRSLYGLGPFVNGVIGMMGSFLGVVLFTLLFRRGQPIADPNPLTLVAAFIGALLAVLAGQFLRGLQYRS